jgi:hypothetical protein
VEAWWVIEPEKDELMMDEAEQKTSALSRHADVLDLLEMSGRTIYSRDVQKKAEEEEY